MGKLEDVGGEGRNGNPGDVETLHATSLPWLDFPIHYLIAVGQLKYSIEIYRNK